MRLQVPQRGPKRKLLELVARNAALAFESRYRTPETHGVEVLEDCAVRQALGEACNAMACELSWSRYRGDTVCPVMLGSQTDHSAMAGRATRVVSL